MKGHTHSVMKRAILAAALAAGISGTANAGMGRFEDIYKYFDHPVIDNSPSAWRQSNPQGASQRELQAMSSEGPAWQMSKPALASAPAEPSLRQTHPGGLTTRELQAMSSDAPAFQLPDASPTEPNVATGPGSTPNKETFAARLANLFRAR